MRARAPACPGSRATSRPAAREQQETNKNSEGGLDNRYLPTGFASPDLRLLLRFRRWAFFLDCECL